jgi:Carboxypeptidase regulatory-like domain
MNLRFVRPWMSVLLFLFCAHFGFGQSVNAAIHGTVNDPSGAVVPDVQVVATNTATGVTFNATSKVNGSFEFLQVPVGTYVVSASKTQFKSYKTNPITLTLNQNYNLPIKLEVGLSTETIEVNAQAVQADTTNTQLQSVVESTQITNLPLIGRNWTQLEQLSPGVVASSDRFGTFSVSGSQSNQSSYLINGMDSNDLPLNTPLIIPSADAIQEFNLITNSINPEYGRNSGAIVSAVIKNGTNKFHGDVFEFYRDTFLNDANFFQKTKPKFHQNTFGATIGGPIWKDKTFFFLSYQGIRAIQPQTGGDTTVFSPAQRGGDFSADGAFTGTSPTPYTVNGTTFAAGTPWATIFPNSQIPTANFNPISQNLLTKFVPLPNSGNDFLFNPQTSTFNNQYIARIDHSFSSNDVLWGTAFYQRSPSADTLPFTGSTLPGFGDVNTRYSYQYVADWNHTFSPSMINELRAGWSYFKFGAVSPQTVTLPSSLGFTGITPQDSSVAGAPFIGVTGFFNLGFSTNGPQPRNDQTYEITESLSKVFGHHTTKFGFDGRRFSVDNPFFAVNNGSFSFGGAGTFSTGNPAADFALGIPDSYSQNSGGVIHARAYEYYMYAQDSWKVTSRLTLNYGLGYQIDTPLNNRQFGGKAFNCFQIGKQSTVFPTAPVGLTFPGDPGCTSSGTTLKANNFGPRVGAAWAPNLGWLSAGDAHKLVINAGWGIFYNRTEEEGALQNLGAPPFGLSSSGAASTGGNPSFAAPFTDISTGAVAPNPFPFAGPQLGSAVDFTPLLPFDINVINKNYGVPYAQNYHLTIERELPSNMLVSVGYVGSIGRNLVRSYEANPITLTGAAACAADPSCVSNRTFQHFFFPDHSLAPGDVFASVGQQVTDGSSNYNSLQVHVRKGFSRNLQFTAAYTWSHALDNGSGLENSGFGTRGTNPYPQFSGLNYGDSGYDARHRFVVGYNYTVPNLHKIFKYAPSVLFKGWMLSGITTLQTGFPVTIADTGFRSLTCDAFSFYACGDQPNFVGTSVKTLDARTASFNNKTNYFFDPSLFARAPIGTMGNARRNFFHGPGINNTDFVIEKDTYFWPGNESRYLALRLEAYNLFNHTQFLNPNGNAASANFGRITSAAPGRQVQLAAKIYF